jgi:integrase
MGQKPKPKIRLSDAIVRRLPVPEKGYEITRDSDTRGFAVRVTCKGVRSFVLDYYTRTGRDRSYTIGQFPDWSVTEAREKAKALRRDIDEGGDPLADIEADRAAPTMAELCDRFEAEHLPRKRPRTAGDYRHTLRLHVRPHFGEHVKVAAVTFGDVDALHRKITRSGSPYMANRVVSMLSKMFGLAQRWGMIEKNPCKGIEKNTEFQRRRYLLPEELARLTAALAEHSDRQAANIIRLMLLTGCRRGEALSARWADIDLGEGVWSKPPSSTKQKQHHSAPLSAPAQQLLADIQAEQQKDKRQPLGEYVFPGKGGHHHRIALKTDWKQLCKAAGISGLRMHDLRHSFASQLASGGASLPLIGALLGHSSPSTTHRYAHLFSDPLRAAVEKVGAVITAAGTGADVVPHPRKGSRAP